jgi:hypothetical protein
MLSVCVVRASVRECPSHPLQLSRHSTDFDKIWYARYAVRIYPNTKLLNPLQSVKAIWQTCVERQTREPPDLGFLYESR